MEEINKDENNDNIPVFNDSKNKSDSQTTCTGLFITVRPPDDKAFCDPENEQTIFRILLNEYKYKYCILQREYNDDTKMNYHYHVMIKVEKSIRYSSFSKNIRHQIFECLGKNERDQAREKVKKFSEWWILQK